jgi:hypothetical protein
LKDEDRGVVIAEMKLCDDFYRWRAAASLYTVQDAAKLKLSE